MTSFFTYNVDNGDLEAIVHGKMSALLHREDYNSLCQCETLSDVRLFLSATDYGNMLPSEATVTPRSLHDAMTQRLVDDFQELRAMASAPLSTFLDFVSYEYMIQNILKLLTGTQHGKHVKDLVGRCHPLGMFAGIEGLASAQTAEEVYELVLIDSPLGRLFERTPITGAHEAADSVEYLRNVLYKNYLESFYDFCCTHLPHDSAEVMCGMLEMEADRHVLTVAVTSLNRLGFSSDDRLALFPSIGTLVDVHPKLSLAESEDALKEALKQYSHFVDLFDDSRGLGGQDPHSGSSSTKCASVERRLHDTAVNRYKDAFAQQFQFGVFLSFLKLKEIEISNITWISECITQNVRHRIFDYTPLF